MGQPGSYLAAATPSSKNHLRDGALCFYSDRMFLGVAGGAACEIGT